MNNNQVAEYTVIHDSYGDEPEYARTTGIPIPQRKPKQIVIDWDKVAEAEAWSVELRGMMGGDNG